MMIDDGRSCQTRMRWEGIGNDEEEEVEKSGLMVTGLAYLGTKKDGVLCKKKKFKIILV